MTVRELHLDAFAILFERDVEHVEFSGRGFRPELPPHEVAPAGGLTNVPRPLTV